MSLNPYLDDLEDRIVAPLGHRAVIGGLWGEMGAKQRDYLLDHGLKPTDFILDIGCGSLRAGVAIVPVVESGHYYGIDLLETLLETGYREEIVTLGLEGRLPRRHLAQSEDFSIPFEDVIFDVALAQSVFTHLPLNHLRLCLHRLRPRMRDGGIFFCTFFVAPDTLAFDCALNHPPQGEVESFGWRDPFHVWERDIAFAAERLGWHIDGIREWGHPRGQKMVHFIAV